MRQAEATEQIAAGVRVTRADVVVAKTYLLSLGAGRIEIEAQSKEWARTAAPGTPRTITLDDDDVADQLSKVARYLSARLALCAAAWELVRSGVMFQVGAAHAEEPSWDVRTRSHGGGLNWNQRFELFYPQAIRRPPWYDINSELFDADLYLLRLASAKLNPHVEEALRLSLACFQRDLYVPCVAMLGAASEGAWIETGEALARRFASHREGGVLKATLDKPEASTKKKIDAICGFYDNALSAPIQGASGIDNKRLRAIQYWSDQVRESRNVLHWGATPSVPNTYEKVAVLLMDAVSELSDLHSVKNAV